MKRKRKALPLLEVKDVDKWFEALQFNCDFPFVTSLSKKKEKIQNMIEMRRNLVKKEIYEGEKT